jgi:hypothetical protein
VIVSKIIAPDEAVGGLARTAGGTLAGHGTTE